MAPIAAARLETFRFAMYVAAPIAAMAWYGAPEWQEKYIAPLVPAFRKDDVPQVAPPQTTEELKAELARLREERLAKKAQREGR